MDRLLGSRYKEYFVSEKNISQLFDRKMVINDKLLDLTAAKIIKNTKEKLRKIPNRTVDAFLVHGDVHHQNVLVSGGDKINFIDLEYSGHAPIAMELAKPYYIDLIGVLFFYFENKLFEYINLIDFGVGDDEIEINVKQIKPLTGRLLLTESKVKTYRELVKSSRDYLTLNEYLIICHLTSRNPNNYSRKAQILFLLFIIALAVFDPFKPSSLFDIFN